MQITWPPFENVLLKQSSGKNAAALGRARAH